MGNPEEIGAVVNSTNFHYVVNEVAQRKNIQDSDQINNEPKVGGKSNTTRAQLHTQERLYNDHTSLNSLSFKSADLQEFPSIDIHNWGTRLVHINIEYNNIEKIPDGLSVLFPNLESFNANGNDISVLPEDFGNLSRLQELHLSENALSKLPESLCKLRKLRIFKIKANALKRLHSEIGQNVCLEELSVDENRLRRLPATLGLLCNLREFGASDNRIECLPSTLNYLKKLSSIDLSINQITEVPDSFGDLANLRHIDLSENKIGRLCDSNFASAPKLERLFLDLNSFPTFPSWFIYLEEITELSMKSNELSDSAIPEGFGFKSQKLKYLDLRGNFIKELPSSFGQLSSLQTLRLGTPLNYLERSPNFQNGNWLRALPKGFCQLSFLKCLCIEENQLVCLPDDFGKLELLEDLFLGSNMIAVLPPTFCELRSMKRCQLSKNRLKTLPDNFGDLATLEELLLDSNMLKSLPDSMKKLVKLEILDLTENRLKKVPKEILDSLVNLKALNMFFNKFDVPHSEIPYIIKQTHYSEKNPEFQGTWRGKNNRPEVMRLGPEKFESPQPNVETETTVGEVAHNTSFESENSDWEDTPVKPPSSSGSSDEYCRSLREEDDEEDWDIELPQKSMKEIYGYEEGQFDLDSDEEMENRNFLIPSPVRFDYYGNSSRPIDLDISRHRQTPYIYHVPKVPRNMYEVIGICRGQFDDAENFIACANVAESETKRDDATEHFENVLPESAHSELSKLNMELTPLPSLDLENERAHTLDQHALKGKDPQSETVNDTINRNIPICQQVSSGSKEIRQNCYSGEGWQCKKEVCLLTKNNCFAEEEAVACNS